MAGRFLLSQSSAPARWGEVLQSLPCTHISARGSPERNQVLGCNQQLMLEHLSEMQSPTPRVSTITAPGLEGLSSAPFLTLTRKP